MPSMLTLASPAKINLFLRILRKRMDGYHELASLFQAIDLCDILHIRPAKYDQLTCTDPDLPTDHANLVIKAMHLFRQKTGISQAFSIHLEKRIPQQAGLGGGSSNAATTLWGLNILCGSDVSEQTLAAWGSEIGSDISFFLSEGTAYCTGRGENIRSLAPLSPQQLYIVKPDRGLSTPQVYGALQVSQLDQRDPEHVLAGFLQAQPHYFNDLELAAFRVAPELAVLKSHLQDLGFSTVLMSGSGSSFFCLGKGNIPDSLAVTSYFAHFINRPKGQWYAPLK